MTSQESNIELSEKALDLLGDAIFSGASGHYAEFDSEGYKPHTPIVIAELINLGFITLSDDSDHIPCLSDLKQAIEFNSEEELDGSANVIATTQGIEYAKSINLEVE